MAFLKKQRLYHDIPNMHDLDPLTGLANLLDLGLVFIVGLILTIFAAFHLQDLFDQKSNFTILKRDSTGQLELIEKKGKKIERLRVSTQMAKGLGERLGTAYRLQDGTYVYVPEEYGLKLIFRNIYFYSFFCLYLFKISHLQLMSLESYSY